MTKPALADQVRYGIVLMLVAWAMFSVLDTGAKWLALLGVPAFQLAFMRYAVHLGAALTVSGLYGSWRHMARTSHPWTVMLRGFLLVPATACNFYALNYLPLSVVSAIMFSSPVIVCLLTHFLMPEKVGPWRWFAIILGFIGVLIIIRPFGTGFHPAMLLILYNALAVALYALLTRRLAGVVSTETMQFYTGLLGTVVFLPFAMHIWVSPDTIFGWSILFALGLLGWGGHGLLTHAHRFASANTLMPFTYSYMIYLTLAGFIVFGNLPDGYTVLGALVVAAAGLIIWKRESI